MKKKALSSRRWLICLILAVACFCCISISLWLGWEDFSPVSKVLNVICLYLVGFNFITILCTYIKTSIKEDLNKNNQNKDDKQNKDGKNIEDK